VTGEEAMKRRVGHYQADGSQFDAKLIKRDVLAIFPERQDLLSMFLDPTRARVPALWLGCKASSCSDAAPATGSPSKAQRQIVPPPNGSYYPHQPQPAAASAGPGLFHQPA